MYVILFRPKDQETFKVHHRPIRGKKLAILYDHKIAADEQAAIMNDKNKDQYVYEVRSIV